MRPKKCPPIFRLTWLYVSMFLIVAAASCFADGYANEGAIFITGTITSIQNQQSCDRYDCHIGSTWSLEMMFRAPEWNARGFNYEFSSVDLTCFGGPPCFTGYHATSDFGWGPWLFDALYAKITNGSVVDARVADGGYFIEGGEENTWSLVDAFSGTIVEYAVPTPEPAGITGLASGSFLCCLWRILASHPRM